MPDPTDVTPEEAAAAQAALDGSGAGNGATFSNSDDNGATAPTSTTPLFNTNSSVFDKNTGNGALLGNGSFLPPDPNRPGQYAAVGPFSAAGSGTAPLLPTAAPLGLPPANPGEIGPPNPTQAQLQAQAAARITAATSGQQSSAATPSPVSSSGGSSKTPMQKLEDEWLGGRGEADALTSQGLVKARDALDFTGKAVDSNSQTSLKLTQDAQTEARREFGLQKVAQEQANTNMIARDAAIQARLDAIKDVDPDRRSVPQTILGAIAIGLGAYGAGITHSRNFALDMINQSISRDVDAQKDNIEKQLKQIEGTRAINSDKNIIDQRRVEIISQEREFGLRNAKDMVDTLSAQSGNEIQKAKLAELSSGIDGEIAKVKSEAFDRRYQVGSADLKAQAAQAQAQQARVRQLLDKANDEGAKAQQSALEKGDTQEVAFAKGQSVRQTFLANNGLAKPQESSMPAGAVAKDGSTPQAPGKRLSEEDKKRVEGIDTALDELRQELAMVEEGGRLSPTRTAQGQSLVSGLHASINQAQTGATRPPSPETVKEIDNQISTDPNSIQFTGRDKARITQTIQDLIDKRKTITGQ